MTIIRIANSKHKFISRMLGFFKDDQTGRVNIKTRRGHWARVFNNPALPQ